MLRAAVALADQSGIESLTMRRLGQELGVEAMSLYHHVANKEALLDGMVDAVVGELIAEVGPGGGAEAERDWIAALRVRIITARTCTSTSSAAISGCAVSRSSRPSAGP